MKKVQKKVLHKTVDPSALDESLLVHTAGPSYSALHTPSTKAAPLEEIVALTEKFIRVPSVSGDIDKAIEILQIAKNELPDHKFTPFVSNSFPSLLYSNQNTNKFNVILNAHLDVVAGEMSQYVPEIKDGKLYGRGAYDMKGAAAVMILLFNELAEQVDYPLGLQLVTEEELPEGDGTEYQLSKGVRTDFAVMGECGSNFRIIHETKGVITAKIKTIGYTAHGAYPWKGKNAILQMYEAIDAIQKHFPVPNGPSDEITVTVSKISTTNETWNKVPDNCTATLDIRYNKKDHTTVLDKIKAVLPENVTFEVRQARNHHFTDPNNQYIQLLKKAGEDVLNKEVSIEKTYGGSDTTYFSNVGSDAIEFGPVGHGQHNGEEWVDIKSLGDYYQILKKFLLSVK